MSTSAITSIHDNNKLLAKNRSVVTRFRMPTSAITSNHDNDKLLTQIHYSLNTVTSATGDMEISDGWSTVHKKTWMFFYNITEKEMLENNSNDHALFHSGAQWALIDDELRNLKIKPKESLIIEFSLITTESPSIPLFMQIMTYPKMEAVCALLLLSGLLALIAALIALIPAVSTVLAVSSATIALAGGVLLAVGMTMALTSYFCNKELKKAPLKKDVDFTIQQMFFPESKKSVSPDAKEMLLPYFFSNGNIRDYSPAEAEVPDEETEAGLSLNF